MTNKKWVLKLIQGAHENGYIELRNDLIEDIKHELNDYELIMVLGLVVENNGDLQSL